MTKELRRPGLHIDLLLSLHCVNVMLGNTDVEDNFQLLLGSLAWNALSCLAHPHSHWLRTSLEIIVLGKLLHAPFSLTT